MILPSFLSTFRRSRIKSFRFALTTSATESQNRERWDWRKSKSSQRRNVCVAAAASDARGPERLSWRGVPVRLVVLTGRRRVLQLATVRSSPQPPSTGSQPKHGAAAANSKHSVRATRTLRNATFNGSPRHAKSPRYLVI